MAITITQQPTSPNAAYTRLVYVISGSSNTTAPQFEYVMDVYESGSTSLISRVTQTVNPAGVAVFDPSRIIQDQLEYNSNWKITNTVSVLSNSKKFALKFGEQYGTSISSSVTVYPNATNNVITTFTGVVDPTQGSYNFPSQSYDSKTALTTFDWYTGSSFSNAQLDRFRVVDYEVDYETISVLGVGSTISNISYRTYDQTGNLMVTNSISGFGLSMYDIFAGPKNFIDKGSVFQSQFEAAWFYYSIAITLGDSSVKYYWYKRSISESNEKVRFAFINKLGVWDYYNNYNPVRRSSDIQRENVTLPRVDYSSTLSPYDITRRGEKSYYTSTKDRFVVDTPLLDKTKANWLEQLLESPSVFIQRGSNFVPVVITNNSYRHNNDSARNKLFKYTIEFEPANQPFGEWVPEYAQKYCPVAPTPSPTPSPTPTPTPVPTSSYIPSGMVTDGLVHFYNAWDTRNTSGVWHDSLHYGEPGEITGSIAAGIRYVNSTADNMPTASYYSTFTSSVASPSSNTLPPVDFGKPWPITVNANSGSAYTIQTFANLNRSPYLFQGVWFLGETSRGNTLNLETWWSDSPPGFPNRAFTIGYIGTFPGTQYEDYFNNQLLLDDNLVDDTNFRLLTMRIGSGSDSPTFNHIYASVDTGSFVRTWAGFASDATTIPADGYNILGQSRFGISGYPDGAFLYDSDNRFMYHAIYNKTLSDAEVAQNYNAFISSSYA